MKLPVRLSPNHSDAIIDSDGVLICIAGHGIGLHTAEQIAAALNSQAEQSAFRESVALLLEHGKHDTQSPEAAKIAARSEAPWNAMDEAGQALCERIAVLLNRQAAVDKLAQAVKEYRDACPADPDATNSFWEAGAALDAALSDCRSEAKG
jgi:hypothetical protein